MTERVRPRRLAILGGAGFIGHHLAGALGTAETFDSLEDTVRTSVLGTVAVLKAALAVSTPVTYVTLGNDWLNPYTITKNAAALLCDMFRSQYGLPTQVVVTYNLYGPYQKATPVRKIIPEIMNRLLTGEPVEVHGDGDQIVDLVYAPDFALELLGDETTGTVHIGTDVPHRVLDVVELCARALGNPRYEIRHVAVRRGEPPHSVSLAPHGYRHIQATPLDAGLAATASWYRDQLPGSPYRNAAR